jgi:hypothetical protein
MAMDCRRKKDTVGGLAEHRVALMCKPGSL